MASWVARVDKEAVRNTKDVDLLVRREDFPRVIDVLQSIGFIHQNVAGVDLFLDGPEGSVRSAIHIVFAGEKVRPERALPTPIAEAEAGPDFLVPTLDALVRMKLTSFRLKDKVHLLDLLDVGLIDESFGAVGCLPRSPPGSRSSSTSDNVKRDSAIVAAHRAGTRRPNLVFAEIGLIVPVLGMPTFSARTDTMSSLARGVVPRYH